MTIYLSGGAYVYLSSSENGENTPSNTNQGLKVWQKLIITRASANHSSSQGEIHFQRPLIAYDVILFNQPWHDLFTSIQTQSLWSLCILNFPVRPRQGPFQRPSTQKIISRTIFYIKLIYSMHAEFIWTPNSSKYFLHK